MLTDLRRAILLTLVLTVVTGVIYPLAVTGVAGVLFPYQANGSLLVRDGRVIGSALIGQRFTGARYFHPRPSAAGDKGYDPTASGGSNLGPADARLIARIRRALAGLGAGGGVAPVPVDLVTASGSGLDPDITPAAAAFQIPRVARARGLQQTELRALVRRQTTGRQGGVLGEARVNVLKLNLALDAMQRP